MSTTCASVGGVLRCRVRRPKYPSKSPLFLGFLTCISWELLILELLLESISAFKLRKTHFDSNLGGFLVILLSFAWYLYCMTIFTSKLPTSVANLLIAWFSLLLVHGSSNSINLASIFVNFVIRAKQTANCFTKIVTKTDSAYQQLFFCMSIALFSSHSYLSKPLLFTRRV